MGCCRDWRRVENDGMILSRDGGRMHSPETDSAESSTPSPGRSTDMVAVSQLDQTDT